VRQKAESKTKQSETKTKLNKQIKNIKSGEEK